MSKKAPNIQAVIKALKKRGWNVEPIKHPKTGEIFYNAYWSGPHRDISAIWPFFREWSFERHYYSAARLYRLYKREVLKGHSYKGTVKDLSDGLDRAAARDILKIGDIEQIEEKMPSKKRIKEEDPWAWD